MKQVMTEIENQTKYLFVYSKAIDTDRIVNVKAQAGSLSDALSQMLAGSDVSYRITNSNIVLSAEQTASRGPVTVRGMVRNENGDPIPGASVVVKGTSTGSSTNLDGSFSITVPAPAEDAVLTVSYLGMQTSDVSVGAREYIDIILREVSVVVDDVVVTALGIKRSEKALSYNVQQVGSDDVTRVKDANLINSLAGKVAGVAINSGSSGVGGASKVVMRGVKGISQSSNALYVIDGVPMYNMGNEGDTEKGSRGTSEPVADLNPEDVESISVLTGAAAAALYGSDAANGAIVINTKRGTAGKLELTVSSNTEFLTPLVLPAFQNSYGTGDLSSEAGSTIKSWGHKLNDANYRGYSPAKDFFETGAVFTNSVSFSTGTEKNQSYFSAASVNSDGIVPNNNYDRMNFTFRNTSNFLKDKMTFDFGASYIIQKDQNMVNQGEYSNPIVSAYLFPRGDDYDAIRVFERYDTSRDLKMQYWPQGEGDFTLQNPYWVAYRNLRNNDRKRYMLNASLNYEVLDWLDLSGRVRVDNSNNTFTDKLYASTPETLTQGENGSFNIIKSDDRQIYADVLANINKRWGDFTLAAIAGASITDMKYDELNIGGPIRIGGDGISPGVANLFYVTNLDDEKLQKSQAGWREQKQSVFGSVEVGYKGAYYLTVTGRNDWSSAMAGTPQEATGFFYPSVGLSAVLSEAFHLPKQIDFLKLRGSFSSVGMPIPRNITVPTYQYDNTLKQYDPKTHYPISKLYAERTDSWELGLSARLFKHFDLDLSFYLADTKNQTFDPKLSVSSGYTTMYVQTGAIRNKGIELSLKYGNNWKDFSWDSNFIFDLNRNEIKELADNFEHPETGEIMTLDRLDIGGYSRARFILKPGGSLGDLYSIGDFKRDSQGNIYVDAAGNVQTQYEGVDDIKLGSVFPRFRLSWRNDFAWRNFSAGIMFSARIGGVVYSATQAALDMYGASEASATARDRGGVMINGGDYLNANTWYTAIGAQGGLPQYYTYSATNVRLSELSVGYTIPRKWLGDVCGITVSLVGRNLWMIYNKAPFDPESVATTGNYYQGIDYFMVPNTRNIGFNIRIKF